MMLKYEAIFTDSIEILSIWKECTGIKNTGQDCDTENFVILGYVTETDRSLQYCLEDLELNVI